MLKTYETKPQLMVSVDGLPAVCHNLTCDFMYTAPVGQVTGFTFDAGTKKVKLTGTDLPAKATDIQKIMFAMSECTVDAETLSATNIDCTLVKEPTCGDHAPTLTTQLGNIPHAEGLTKITVTCTITKLHPIANLNLLGADNITFTGTNFPHELETSTVEIEFNDVAKTKCVP